MYAVPFVGCDRSAFRRDLHHTPKNRACRRCSQGDEKLWTDQLHLLLPPRQARFDLMPIGTPMQPELAPSLPLEMLHRVRHVAFCAVDAGVRERAIEEPSRRAD